MDVGMSPLGRVAIGVQDLWPVPAHEGSNHDGAAGWSGTMDEGVIAAQNPLECIAVFDPHPGLVQGHDLGT